VAVEIPKELRYTEDHEWVRSEDGKLRVGITDYAQDALGDVVFVDLPEPGSHFDADDTMAEVESTKSVAEVYAPVAGTIVERNSALDDAPEMVNGSPYGDGWFVVMEPDDPAAADGLLDAAAYAELTG
jgi:glycine cleavage system H protein